MESKTLTPPGSVSRYVNNLFVLNDYESRGTSVLPFYADGFPGVAFQQCAGNNAILLPKKKQLSDFFLYGQTLEPIAMHMEGTYDLVVFQLFPFASRVLFGIDPVQLNDDCYDLKKVEGIDTTLVVKQLSGSIDNTQRIELITAWLQELIRIKADDNDRQIRAVIDLIIAHKGKVTVKFLTEELHLTERTLQRLFKEYVGISPKQFAKIIQFQSSVGQMSDDSFTQLTEIVYKNGYADQSHFIRNFRKYSGKKPSQFLAQK